MKNILDTVFLDNPYISEQVCAFCNQLPELREAEQEYQAAEQELEDRLGYDAFSRFEEVQSWYMAQLARAHYLFGLGLRRELLSALTGT